MRREIGFVGRDEAQNFADKEDWSERAQNRVSERYTKFPEERDFRLEWEEKTGLGFELPTSAGQLGNFASLREWLK